MSDDSEPITPSPLGAGLSDAEIRAGLEGRRLRAELRARLFGASSPRVMVGPYVLGRKLGAGAVGTVYAAEASDGSAVAVKLLQRATDETAARLRREGKAMSRIRHPNVVRVHDVGTCADGVYIAMDYVEGTTLRRWLEADHDIEEVVAVLVQLAEGLTAAHDVGLVHRDVKPENVLMDGSRPRLTDFGLATALPGSSIGASTGFGERLTATGRMVGTIAYMAPEQLLGRPATPATDQFGLAVTAFEALYRAAPFRGLTTDAVALAIIEGTVTPPPQIPEPRIHTALLKALAPEPTERFASVTELANALRSAPPPPAAASTWLSRLLRRS